MSGYRPRRRRAESVDAIQAGAATLRLPSFRRKAGGGLAPSGKPAMKLHIGGTIASPDWKILDVVARPEVDFIGPCTDLGQFADGSIDEIYASHVLEHLGYREELPRALAEWHRVLRPGGQVKISVPDMMKLCGMFAHPQLPPPLLNPLLAMMYGGQGDAHDFHKMGFTQDILAAFLHAAGFERVARVEDFGLFDDTSRTMVGPIAISLNVQAFKPL
jgi:predicted SAM-dependent methyltransferase